MTTIRRYDNPNDVSMRLSGTYLRYKGKCYYADYHGDFNVQLYAAKSNGDPYDGIKPFKIVDANDPELDISSAPLGYCNLPGHGPVYLSRPPERRQRQGVTPQNLSGYDESIRQWRRPIAKYMHMNPQSVIDTVEGVYPSLREIIEEQNPKIGAAFHRRLCLLPISKKGEGRLTWKIKYMSTFIGILQETPTGLVASLVDGHGGNSFLRYTLQSQGVDINDYA